MKKLAIALGLSLTLLGGAAWAAIPSSGGIITGCYTNGPYKNLRVIDAEAE